MHNPQYIESLLQYNIVPIRGSIYDTGIDGIKDYLTNKYGNVKRCAIDRVYIIATRHKETLWDFADALREYGFIDAIYITGGADHVFYRDKDEVRHDIGDIEEYPHMKWRGVTPWLVFRQL